MRSIYHFNIYMQIRVYNIINNLHMCLAKGPPIDPISLRPELSVQYAAP
jgi:hypothetical protein